jgi:hypothetical protein
MGKMERIAKPFLFGLATDRTPTNETDIGGYYCEEAQVWVVQPPDGIKPIIETASDVIAETQTKTMTQVEADDDDFGRGTLMETTTMTKVGQEADDTDASFGALELVTKTEIQQESDDADPVGIL